METIAESEAGPQDRSQRSQARPKGCALHRRLLCFAPLKRLPNLRLSGDWVMELTLPALLCLLLLACFSLLPRALTPHVFLQTV